MKKTKQNYEEYLNQLYFPHDNDMWIIGGKNRYWTCKGKYGTAIRRYDPIQFEVGFEEWTI